MCNNFDKFSRTNFIIYSGDKTNFQNTNFLEETIETKFKKTCLHHKIQIKNNVGGKKRFRSTPGSRDVGFLPQLLPTN